MNTSPDDYGLKILGQREYSILEFRDKLLKKFPEEAARIEEIIQEFIEQDWLSEGRFCEVFIRDQVLKKQGIRKIEQKLLQKGIGKTLCAEKLSAFCPEAVQEEIARHLADRKKEIFQKRGKFSDFETHQKVKQFLVGRGFSFDIIEKVV